MVYLTRYVKTSDIETVVSESKKVRQTI